MKYRLCAVLFTIALSFFSNPEARAQTTSAPANQQAPASNSSQWSSSSQEPAALSGADSYLHPEPAASSYQRADKFHAQWEGEEHYGLLSRVGVGADVGPLGVGFKSAVILTDTIDGRLMGNFFNFNSANFDVDGTTAHGNLHLASLGALADFYPKNSIFRISSGLMLWNGNQISVTANEAPGTNFTVDGQTYYSAKTAPLSASGLIGLHTHEPAFILSGGFGRFVPHSQRHWSFPSEFGVVFMGAPTLSVTPSGTVCTDAALTNCSNVADTSTAVGAAFNSSLQNAEARWRRSLGRVTVYPIFTYGVSYSFNLGGR
jgi:hypothetical protein